MLIRLTDRPKKDYGYEQLSLALTKDERRLLEHAKEKSGLSYKALIISAVQKTYFSRGEVKVNSKCEETLNALQSAISYYGKTFAETNTQFIKAIEKIYNDHDTEIDAIYTACMDAEAPSEKERDEIDLDNERKKFGEMFISKCRRYESLIPWITADDTVKWFRSTKPSEESKLHYYKRCIETFEGSDKKPIYKDPLYNEIRSKIKDIFEVKEND